jgi:TetR/AcrR family tetracycline transcriptional repressor
MPISRDEIVDEAIKLLDAVGLEGVTLRRLAGILGVQAPTLYWHVRNKRELLDLMATELFVRSVPPDMYRPRSGQPWWEWLTERARAVFAALVDHRDAPLVIAGNRPTIDSLPNAERSLEALTAVGFPPREALHVLLVIAGFAAGCALEVQQLDRRTADDHAADRAVFERIAQDERFPVLRSIVTSTTTDPNRDTFEVGLGWIVGGLRLRHQELVEITAQV